MGTGLPQTRAPLRAEPLPVELMNTVWADRDGVHDALADPLEALGWLHAVAEADVRVHGGVSLHRAIGIGVGAFDLMAADAASGTEPAQSAEGTEATKAALLTFTRRLVGLRDALRRLAADATGDPRPAAESAVHVHEEAVDIVNRSSALGRSWSRLVWPPGGEPGSELRTGGEPADLVLAILAEEGVALFADPGRPGLRACLAPGCVLYFTDANPRREWCSAACGNRARVARHYQRRHQRAED
ncbi:MAG: CGNR zinc finger domain-containing protein [Actinocrinis sp.]